MAPRLALACVLAAACQRHGLADVPIVGGTLAQRDAAVDELAWFADAALADEVVLSRVVFGLPGHGAAGEYQVWNHRILLRADLSPESTAQVLRHELCHALDEASDRPSADMASLDRGLELALAHAVDAHIADEVQQDPERRRAEAFALVCELGPIGGPAAGEPCGTEPEVWAEGVDEVVELVWRSPAPRLGPGLTSVVPAGSIRRTPFLLSGETGIAGFFGEVSYCIDVHTLAPWPGNPGPDIILGTELDLAELHTVGTVHGSAVTEAGQALAIFVPDRRTTPRVLVRDRGSSDWSVGGCAANVDTSDRVLVAPLVEEAFWVASGGLGSFRVDEWVWPDRALR